MRRRALLRRRAGAPGGRGGAHESARFACLGFDFAVTSDDASLVAYVERLYGACVAPGTPSHVFSLRSEDGGGFTLALDGRACVERVLPGSAVAHLVWEVNRAVADHAGDHLLLHAAAAERDGAVVLLPAPRESGKSTLVAGLVRAGMRYLTDEATAVSLTSGGVTGFAKPIGLDPGSWQVLADLEPLTAGAPAPLPSMQWLVPPLALRPDSVATGGRAAIVVLPCYRADAPTVLQPIPRAEALVAMAESSFNFHALGGRALHALAALLRDATCFRLDVSDLDTACNAISEAMPLASREVSG